MPRKLRELIAELRKAGFVAHSGKGSHRNFSHPAGAKITLSGQPGDNTKPYQEKALKRVLEAIEHERG